MNQFSLLSDDDESSDEGDDECGMTASKQRGDKGKHLFRFATTGLLAVVRLRAAVVKTARRELRCATSDGVGTGIATSVATFSGKCLGQRHEGVVALHHTRIPDLFIFAVHDDQHTKMVGVNAAGERQDGRYVDGYQPLNDKFVRCFTHYVR